jgi:Xaa-His dipeptidase
MEEFKTGFLKYFYEISKIPRKSGNEEKIAKYLIEFAKERNLKYYTDSKFNVVIWKDASIGYEDKEILGFQCHTDMVCEKVDGSNHDFLKDSLKLKVEDGYIKTYDTTLGADNGIGVSYILEIIDSNLKMPKLECIFTSREETTMEGVRFLDGNILKSRRIISFDNFLDTEILISSATAKRWVSKIYMKRQEKDENLIYYKLDISGFKGGHSGIDIWDNKRGNPIKIVVDNLNELESIRVVEISGGSSENVIPRDIKVVFAIEETERGILEKIESKLENLKKVYGNICIYLRELEEEKEEIGIYSKEDTKRLLEYIVNYKNGPLEYDKEGNVILSANLGRIESFENYVLLKYSVRYNDKNIGEKLVSEIEEDMEKYNVICEESSYMLGYEEPKESKLLDIVEKAYIEVMGNIPKKKKSQACLECGYLGQKIENLEYIAIAPNIFDAHSPKERAEIESANNVWRIVEKIILTIDEKENNITI